MARSLRSKRRRKLMAIKRKRYGKKELIRLKKMLGLPTTEEVAPSKEVKVEETDTSAVDTTVITSDEVQHIEQPDQGRDEDWEEIEEEDKDIAQVIKTKRPHKIRASYRPNARDSRARSVRLRHEEKEKVVAVVEGEQMDHDQLRRYNRQTQRDQFGNYPVWMNQKTVKLLAKNNKKVKRLGKKKQYKHRCKTNTHKYSKQTRETKKAGVDEPIIGFKKIPAA